MRRMLPLLAALFVLLAAARPAGAATAHRAPTCSVKGSVTVALDPLARR